jgi:hypothetical protein
MNDPIKRLICIDFGIEVAKDILDIAAAKTSKAPETTQKTTIRDVGRNCCPSKNQIGGYPPHTLLEYIPAHTHTHNLW